jgi:signal transduction histidine kinase
VDVPADLPLGRGDEQRLTQVLMNLAGNAIKFCEQGRVGIAVHTDNVNFCVMVSDTGPGIPEDQHKIIFEEFQQADSSSRKRKGGTGLGLAISQRFVQMHGGRIWVESRVGEGSTFRFTVPVQVSI